MIDMLKVRGMAALQLADSVYLFFSSNVARRKENGIR
jgi:hypothetical protein